MSAPVHIADPNMTIQEAAQWMRSDDVGALPVGENDMLIGMVTDRDIVTRAVADERAASATSVRDVMSEGVCYCFEDDDVDGAAQVMAKNQVRRLPVLNRNKRLVGLIALADLGRESVKAVQDAVQGISEPSETARRES
jgi:CBS-domain-containing membrane protein